ncbi:MAG: hypothetical protein EXR76_10290 [Myxococcales bacterium]|nr:hypothetical protein [Myxococcales bacterium]
MQTPLLQTVIEVHGGLERYHATSAFDVSVHIAGPLFLMRLCSPLRRDLRLLVSTQTIGATCSDWPRRGLNGVFASDEVRIVDAQRQVLQRRALPATLAFRTLVVKYPDQFPTHSPTQTFAFDGLGRLRRLDYTAHVFGDWARAAHFCDEYESFDGFLVSTRRAACARISGGVLRSMPLLYGGVTACRALT